MDAAVDVTEVVMEAEAATITTWANNHNWSVTYDPISKQGTARTTHPALGTEVNFHFDTTGYPDRQPPAWWCGPDPADPKNYPRPAAAARPGQPVGSIFHAQPVICAPWNRLAYTQVVSGAPHSDWTLGSWKTMAPEHTRAHTIADMLSALDLHLSFSDGMQA
jgi:hypothetical protein